MHFINPAALFVKSVLRNIRRGVKTTPALCYDVTTARRLAIFKKKQADFQVEDGVPIHLRTGLCDRLLYVSTLVGCFFGVINTFLVVYDNAKPPSWKKAC